MESIINNNIEIINNRIEHICQKAGISREDIILIGVTKTRNPDEINEAIRGGIGNIGENKVQEILDKYDKVLPVKWHMIGHLQTNKVKYIIDKVDMIHSVDSIKLAEEIDRRAKQHNLKMNVLIQVNVAEEESKFGIKTEDLASFLMQVEKYDNIIIKGLMTVAPYVENPEDVRIFFHRMKQIFDTYKSSPLKNIDMKFLSMGMTNDFEVAIEEGANMIRIGTAIFGSRNYI